MVARLQSRLESYERQKTAVQAELRAWPPDRLHTKPGPAAWSGVELLDHLVRVERGCVAAMRANLPDGQPVQMRDRVGAVMVRLANLSPARIRVPAQAAVVLPGAMRDVDAVLAEWRVVGDMLASLLASLEPRQLRVGLFQHPVAGWMRAEGAVAFLSSHLRHHGYQIRRLRAATS